MTHYNRVSIPPPEDSTGGLSKLEPRQPFFNIAPQPQQPLVEHDEVNPDKECDEYDPENKNKDGQNLSDILLGNPCQEPDTRTLCEETYHEPEQSELEGHAQDDKQMSPSSNISNEELELAIGNQSPLANEMIVDEESCCNYDPDETEMHDGKGLGQMLEEYEEQAFVGENVPHPVQKLQASSASLVVQARSDEIQRLMPNVENNPIVSNTYCQDPMFMNNYGQEIERSQNFLEP